MVLLRTITVITVTLLLATSIAGASSTTTGTSDQPLSLRGSTNRRAVTSTHPAANEPNGDEIVSTLSKSFLHAAVGTIDHLYDRSLESQSISPTKVSTVLKEGMGCIYGQSTTYAQKNTGANGRQLQSNQLGICLTKMLGSNRVIRRKGIIQKAFQLASKPLNARPDHVLPEKKANKIVRIISIIAELSDSHAEFKNGVLLYIDAEIESGDVKMDQEALDGLDFFLTVANLGDE